MKKCTFLFAVIILITVKSFAQIDFNSVAIESWIGSGANEAMFIVDFDADPSGMDSTFAWGIRFETDSVSGDSILSWISKTNSDFSYEMGGGFLNNINYYFNSTNYTNPNEGWFSILESTDGTTWNWNNGITDKIANQEWFGIVAMNPDTFEAEINVPLITSFSEYETENKVELYPNPATNVINIKLSEYAKITISDLNGQILYRNYSIFEKIDLEGFKPGMYIVIINNSGIITSEKIIIK